MTEYRFRGTLSCNEPIFTYRNEDYQILFPNGKYLADLLGDESEDKWFDTVDDLLDSWFIQGVCLCEALKDADFGKCYK